MKKILMLIVLLWVSFGLGYFIGQAQMKVKTAEKKAEVIKNALQKRAVIQAEPNASRLELLKLMRNGEL